VLGSTAGLFTTDENDDDMLDDVDDDSLELNEDELDPGLMLGRLGDGVDTDGDGEDGLGDRSLGLSDKNDEDNIDDPDPDNRVNDGGFSVSPTLDTILGSAVDGCSSPIAALAPVIGDRLNRLAACIGLVRSGP
jgi:hypothetical protein